MKSEAEKQAEGILKAYSGKNDQASMLALIKAAIGEMPSSEGMIIITLGIDGHSHITATVGYHRIIAEFEVIKHTLLHNIPKGDSNE